MAYHLQRAEYLPHGDFDPPQYAWYVDSMRAWCGSKPSAFWLTADPSKVDCKRCRRMIDSGSLEVGKHIKPA